MRALVLVTLVSLGCASEVRTREVRVDLRDVGAPEALEITPGSAVRSRRVDGEEVLLTLDGERPVQLVHPRACPFELAPSQRNVRLVPWVTAAGIAQGGFGQRFRIVVQAGCEAARTGSVSWSEVAGAPLEDVELAARGWVYAARFESLLAARGAPSPDGIVPLSAGQRGTHRLHWKWQWEEHALEGDVEVHAAARATGLPNLALGHAGLLSGVGWHVVSAPDGGLAKLDARDDHTRLLVDRPGRWELARDRGEGLTLDVGDLSQTPLDCGRSGCHAAAAEGAAQSPMTTVFARSVTTGSPGSCARACHVLGEEGLPDRGFWDVAQSLEWRPPLDGGVAWSDVPRALRRVSGVSCLSCHGAARIPPESARWKVLRSEVCATCHDAPPRYGHVQAWSGTAMAHADAAPETRVGSCADCHTTSGFLTRLGAKARPAPEPLGLTCATCHAPHASHGKRLLRQPVLPFSGERIDDSTRLCASCHGPSSPKELPRSGAAGLVLEWGVDVKTGARLGDGRPSHQCIDCHRHSDSTVERGAGHGFVAREADCVTCHEQRHVDAGVPSAEERLVLQRAFAAGLHLDAGVVTLDTPEGRRAWNSRLVQTDRAAWAHGGNSALRLLRDDRP